jgi:hypothetical protein
MGGHHDASIHWLRGLGPRALPKLDGFFLCGREEKDVDGLRFKKALDLHEPLLKDGARDYDEVREFGHRSFPREIWALGCDGMNEKKKIYIYITD